ncbi:MAG: iron-containing alcohol dehydrogenase [Candidatus Dormiibacterota bacterium]
MSATHVGSPVERVLHGSGVAASLPEELHLREATRVVIVSSATLNRETPVISALERALQPHHLATFTKLSQHTPESAVQELATLLRELRADAVVSVGGGSVIDGCKAALHARGAESAVHLALPTTLSGAEFTASAGVTHTATRQKLSLFDRRAAPRVVILDPQLTLATPDRLWLASGIRAVDHAVETVLSPIQDELCTYLSLEALKRLRLALPQCHRDPQDLSARHRAQVAAWWAALGLASVPMGPSHSLGKLLGARFGIPHGITSCVFLPTVLAQIASSEPARLEPLAAAFEVAGPPEVADGCRALIKGLGLPATLSEAGLASADLPAYLETVPAPWREVVRSVY